MNPQNTEITNLSHEATNCQRKQHKSKSQKRKRQRVIEATADNPSSKRLKSRQPKTLFRPWCDDPIAVETTDVTVKTINTNKRDIQAKPTTDLPNILCPTATSLTSYQRAVQQRQLQNALALHMSYYGRQYVMNSIWMQQCQLYQQQMMQYYHHQQQQQTKKQLFGFDQQQQQQQQQGYNTVINAIK